MADQADLVEVLHTLHQVLNYRGLSRTTVSGGSAESWVGEARYLVTGRRLR